MPFKLSTGAFALCLALALALAGLAGTAQAAGKEVTLWGKQVAGSGHAKNATQDGNKVKVVNKAEIMKIEGTAQSYCIWKVGEYKGYLCGGKGQPSIIGKELPAGSYIVRAGLSKGQSSAQVDILLKLK